jgi:RNA polymerase sigma-70 factor (ECF subfamily)
VQILSGLAKVRDAERLGAWMTSVCVKTVRTEIRRRRVRRFFHTGPAEVTRIAAPVEDHDARELLERVYALLDALPANERIAFVLRYIDERPLLQVAEACGCSLATIKRRLSKAEKRFTQLAQRDRAIAERLARGTRANAANETKLKEPA